MFSGSFTLYAKNQEPIPKKDFLLVICLEPIVIQQQEERQVREHNQRNMFMFFVCKSK